MERGPKPKVKNEYSGLVGLMWLSVSSSCDMGALEMFSMCVSITQFSIQIVFILRHKNGSPLHRSLYICSPFFSAPNFSTGKKKKKKPTNHSKEAKNIFKKHSAEVLMRRI